MITITGIIKLYDLITRNKPTEPGGYASKYVTFNGTINNETIPVTNPSPALFLIIASTMKQNR